MSIDRETLAAYAEGQLDATEQQRVEAAIAADPALADEVAAHRALRERLRAHFAPILEMPVPDRLREAVLPSAEVIDLDAVRKARGSSWIMSGAIAASLALGVIVGTQVRDGGPIGNVGGRMVAQGALDKALTTQLAAAQAQPIHVPLSFRNAQGRYCRVFDDGANAGIACRDDQRWVIDRLQSGSGAGDTQYRQAGSVMGEIMAAAQAMAPDGALAPQQEEAAKARGWK
jgi:hypothetical protein